LLILKVNRPQSLIHQGRRRRRRNCLSSCI
jgi:hypothetical protein